MASFDMILSLHCDLAPRIILACPLGFQLLLTWVCYLPASTATSSMLWHFVEHTQCVHWTRPERANCSHAPEPTRWPPWLWPTQQHHATRSPSLSYAPSRPSPRPAGQALAAADARQPCTVQRRPSHSRSPPGPWNSACSSASVSTSARRRHVALATERRSPEGLSMAAAEPISTSYKKRTPNPFKHAGNLRMLP